MKRSTKFSVWCIFLGTNFGVSLYNFIRPHMGLGGRMPAETVRIKITGHDKWMTIIGNTGLHRLAAARRAVDATAA